jgi:hypothetical protein
MNRSQVSELEAAATTNQEELASARSQLEQFQGQIAGAGRDAVATNPAGASSTAEGEPQAVSSSSLTHPEIHPFDERSMQH